MIFKSKKVFRIQFINLVLKTVGKASKFSLILVADLTKLHLDLSNWMKILESFSSQQFWFAIQLILIQSNFLFPRSSTFFSCSELFSSIESAKQCAETKSFESPLAIENETHFVNKINSRCKVYQEF